MQKQWNEQVLNLAARIISDRYDHSGPIRIKFGDDVCDIGLWYENLRSNVSFHGLNWTVKLVCDHIEWLFED